jgi:carbon storage regulator
MLVLSRFVGETIVIDGGIRLTVVAIRGNKVRLGIEAPRTTEVHREEIYKAIHAESSKPKSPDSTKE